VIHFTLALVELAGLVVNTLLLTALVPLTAVATLVGGVFLIRRIRRR
jgi:hypothetical protein